MLSRLLSCVLCVPLLAASAPSRRRMAPAAARRVTLKTSDGWSVAAWYRAPRPGREAVVLIHGLGSSHGEWYSFEKRLRALGWGTLAVDMRGHGLSLSGPRGRTRYSSFGRGADWVAATRDIGAAVEFLVKEGTPKKRIGLIGASIGANLAAQAAVALSSGTEKSEGRAHRQGIGWLVLLSPGADYAGVRVPDSFPCPTAVAASRPDSYAFAEARSLARSGRADFFKASSGHGVNMFPDKAFLGSLLRWIELRSR